MSKTHGCARNGHQSPEYLSWASMRTRCNNPNTPYFARYGGRGIKCCDRWVSFESFLADMGPRPTASHTLDRIDSDGDYCPENCRWSTWHEQENNRRNNVILEVDGESRTVSQWAPIVGLNASTIYARINRGWTAERAIKEPSNAKYVGARSGQCAGK